MGNLFYRYKKVTFFFVNFDEKDILQWKKKNLIRYEIKQLIMWERLLLKVRMTKK